MHRPAPYGWLLAGLCCAPAHAQTTADYVELTNNYRDVTNFNVETVRGIAYSASDGLIYGLNTHGSTIVRHDDLDSVPDQVWPTLNNPMAIQLWQDKLLVVGGSTHALALHDRMTGAILDVLELPSEPGDIVVDHVGDRAFVASQGANAVVEIDLTTFTETRRYDIPAAAPRFLFLEGSGTSLRVFVAPMLSGNNTTLDEPIFDFTQPLAEATGGILDLGAIGIPGAMLPDEDLFEIDPTLQTVTPILSGAGTILTAHGRNPLSGDYWMLGFDAENARPGQTTEFELRGDFGKNLATIVDGFGSPPALKFVDLDDADPVASGGQYSPARSVSFPYALEFGNVGNPFGFEGWGMIASSTGDVVSFHDPGGAWFYNLVLPDGSIPRDLLLDPSGIYLFVYCWGTNEIRAYGLFDLTAAPLIFSLGHDPTPDAVKRGREIWYDAHRSENARSTCNSCHANQGTDLLGWQLSAGPEDYKDVMVTQSLKSIQDTPDYHWRGERSLHDFNGAFPGLLGAAGPLTDPELDDFVEFVFSSQAHANPRQSLERVVETAREVVTFTDGTTSFVSDAVQGQDDYQNMPAFFGRTCVQCHSFPAGTMSFEVNDGTSTLTTITSFDVAHLRQLLQKDLATVPVAGQELSRTGFGVLHNGIVPSLAEFIRDDFSLTLQQAANVTSFVKQWDEGIAPRAHAVIRMEQPGAAASSSRVGAELEAQAKEDWIDVIAIRSASPGGPERWLFDPVGDTYLSSVSGTTTTRALLEAAVTSGASAPILFLGTPWGDGERLALDPDNDGLHDYQELALGSDPMDPNSDGDAPIDGVEVQNGFNPAVTDMATDTTAPSFVAGFPRLDFVVAGAAKFFVQADEPVTVRAIATHTTSGAVLVTEATVATARHTIVLDTLDPSTPTTTTNKYDVKFEITDLAGLTRTSAPILIGMEDMLDEDLVETDEMIWVTVPTTTQTLGRAHVKVLTKKDVPNASPVAGRIVVAQILTRTSVTEDWTIETGYSSANRVPRFSVQVPGQSPVPYGVLPGPFLLSEISNGTGTAGLKFDVAGLPAGTHVRVNILQVLEPVSGFNYSSPVFVADSVSNWSMPSSDREDRGIETTL